MIMNDAPDTGPWLLTAWCLLDVETYLFQSLEAALAFRCHLGCRPRRHSIRKEQPRGVFTFEIEEPR
jgi:hypothetical protein